MLHALVGHAFDAAAPLLVTYGLAMVLLALTNALTYYGIATHRLAFTVPLFICTFGTLAAIATYHPIARDGRRHHGLRQRRGRTRRCHLAGRAAAYGGTSLDRLKRVLLVGGSGQLGTAIQTALEGMRDRRAFTRSAETGRPRRSSCRNRTLSSRRRRERRCVCTTWIVAKRNRGRPSRSTPSPFAMRRVSRATPVLPSLRSAPTTSLTARRPTVRGRATRHIRSRFTAPLNSRANSSSTRCECTPWSSARAVYTATPRQRGVGAVHRTLLAQAGGRADFASSPT